MMITMPSVCEVILISSFGGEERVLMLTLLKSVMIMSGHRAIIISGLIRLKVLISITPKVLNMSIL